MVPHVSNRENIYLFPIVNDADYLAIDTDPTANFWPFVGATPAVMRSKPSHRI